jgi:hypothetical protein
MRPYKAVPNRSISRGPGAHDAGDQPAKFVAYYLLGKDEKNDLKMAP